MEKMAAESYGLSDDPIKRSKTLWKKCRPDYIKGNLYGIKFMSKIDVRLLLLWSSAVLVLVKLCSCVHRMVFCSMKADSSEA